MGKNEKEEGAVRGSMQVISRSSAIMRVIASHPEGLSLTAIANEVDLPRSTVQRLVTALEVEGLVDPKGPAGGSRLGPAIGHFLAAAHADMIIYGRSYLKQLTDNAMETASVICTVGSMAMVLESFSYDYPLRVVLSAGTQSPLYATAGGKAILAFYDNEEIEALLPEQFTACTVHTLGTRAALFAELAAIRQTGIAYAQEEHTLGLTTVAVACESYTGLYAFEISLPTARFQEKKDRVVGALLKSREMIEELAPQSKKAKPSV